MKENSEFRIRNSEGRRGGRIMNYELRGILWERKKENILFLTEC